MLRQVVADYDDTHPIVCKTLDDAENRVFRSHIHTNRWSMQDKQLWINGQPTADQNTLLIATGKRLHRDRNIRCHNLQIGNALFRNFSGSARADDTERIAQAVQNWQRDIVLNRLFEEKAFRQSVFGNIADAIIDSISGRLRGNFLAVQSYRARLRRHHTRQC